MSILIYTYVCVRVYMNSDSSNTFTWHIKLQMKLYSLNLFIKIIDII